jgi:hypothetical protein
MARFGQRKQWHQRRRGEVISPTTPRNAVSKNCGREQAGQVNPPPSTHEGHLRGLNRAGEGGFAER